jgi:hypothetical protein
MRCHITGAHFAVSRPPDDIVPTNRELIEPADRAAYYREMAAFIRTQLSVETSAQVREELIAVAADYERLATHVEDSANKPMSD